MRKSWIFHICLILRVSKPICQGMWYQCCRFYFNILLTTMASSKFPCLSWNLASTWGIVFKAQHLIDWDKSNTSWKLSCLVTLWSREHLLVNISSEITAVCYWCDVSSLNITWHAVTCFNKLVSFWHGAVCCCVAWVCSTVPGAAQCGMVLYKPGLMVSRT